MTTEELLALHGPVVAPETLTTTKALDLAITAVNAPELAVRVVEARRREDGVCSLVVDVFAAVGQKPCNDIREEERLLLVFDVSDRVWPTVYALRDGFPASVQHLNIVAPGLPPCLCVSVDDYMEVQRDWTPEFFIRLIRQWLEATARGDLHRPDQPVEPFLLNSVGTLIVPEILLTKDGSLKSRWAARKLADDLFQVVPKDEATDAHAALAIFSATAPAREHRIEAPPGDIAALARLVDSAEFDLLQLVKEQVRAWQAARVRDGVPTLLLQIPITRSAGGPVECYDVRAFALGPTITELGVRLGIIDDLYPDAALLAAEGNDGSGASIEIFNIHWTLSREVAATFNGERGQVPLYVAVGVGALGSQLLMNLTRGGAPPSAVIDKDRLLPHNLARHLLLSHAIGAFKAEAVANSLSSVLDDSPDIRAVTVDVLTSAADTQLSKAEVVLDMSASVAVARRLAIDVPGAARRISIYLNPSGIDLVLLAEDVARTVRLDQLELQYYWSILQDASLADHLAESDRTRYGGGCRDVSARIRQTTLAVHAANGAAAFRRAVSDPGPSAFAWRLDEVTGTIVRSTLDVRPMRSVNVGGWTVFLSSAFLGEVTRCRASKLPNETGGVLVGALDLQRKIAYIVGSIAAPPDSKEWPTGYIRGSFGLRRSVTELCSKTGWNLQYLGEWHSHPDGATTKPSPDDTIAFEWLARALIPEGRPPIMLIVGGQGIRFVMNVAEAELTLAA